MYLWLSYYDNMDLNSSHAVIATENTFHSVKEEKENTDDLQEWHHDWHIVDTSDFGYIKNTLNAEQMAHNY